MTINLFVAIAPQLILSFGIVLSLLLIAWQRSERMIQLLTLATMFFALLVNIGLFSTDSTMVTVLLKVDRYSIFALMLIIISSLLVVALSRDYLKAKVEVHDEYYLLIQLMALGASILVVSDHFASLFLGFELLSIALVGLVGYFRDDKYAVETGFKYLILSATASSFMLLGIAFIYSQTGQLSFSAVKELTLVNNTFYAIGMLLFFIGIAFKLSLVPFHFWTPDVYQGAPTPIAMLLATVSKVAMFTVLMKCWFTYAFFPENLLPGGMYQPGLLKVVTIIAMLSMLAGNSLALRQNNIKRLLGYSSIAHMGYLLIVLVVSSSQSISFAWQSALFYLAAYVLASLSIFMVIMLTEAQHNKITGKTIIDDMTIDHWQGLFWQNRSLALLVIIALLSLAGIPLSMGFIGKFYLLSHAVNMQLWWLITTLIVGSGIGLFYYLRIIFALFVVDKPIENHQTTEDNKYSNLQLSTQFLVVLLIIMGITLGIFPDSISQILVTL